jgi:hypothetical protein
LTGFGCLGKKSSRSVCKKIENAEAILQFEKWQKNRNADRYEIAWARDNGDGQVPSSSGERATLRTGRFETHPTDRQVAPSFGERATPRTGRLETYSTNRQVENLLHEQAG